MKNVFLISLLLIGVLSVFSLRVNASDQSDSLAYSLEIKGINYPHSVQLGEDIVIDVTVEHCLMKAIALHIIVYEKGKWENPFEDAYISRNALIVPSDIKWIRAAAIPLEGVPYTLVSRDLSESTFTIIYKYPQSASRTVELVIDAYISLPYQIHREVFKPMDSETISIEVKSDMKHGLVVNGGFEYGMNGWSLDNRSGGSTIVTGSEIAALTEAVGEGDPITPYPMASESSKNVVLGSQSPCLKLHVYKHALGSAMRTGVEQTIPETILDEDAQISFRTRLTTPLMNEFKTALTQLSIEFDNKYRINYLIIKQDETRSPLLYREKLPYEANILVTEPTTDWQYINRNLRDDFESSFGSTALRPFNDATVIVETASMGMMNPYTVYIDDIALNEVITSTPKPTPEQPEPTTEPPEEPAPTTTPEETPTVTQEAPLVQEGFTLGTTEMGIIGAVIVALVAIIGFLSYSRRKK